MWYGTLDYREGPFIPSNGMACVSPLKVNRLNTFNASTKPTSSTHTICFRATIPCSPLPRYWSLVHNCHYCGDNTWPPSSSTGMPFGPLLRDTCVYSIEPEAQRSSSVLRVLDTPAKGRSQSVSNTIVSYLLQDQLLCDRGGEEWANG